MPPIQVLVLTQFARGAPGDVALHQNGVNLAEVGDGEIPRISGTLHGLLHGVDVGDDFGDLLADAASRPTLRLGQR